VLGGCSSDDHGAGIQSSHAIRQCLRAPGHQEAGSQLVNIPRGLPATPALVIAFHGLGQGGPRLSHGSDLDAASQRHHFVVAYPDANTGFRWQLNHRDGDEDVENTSALIDALVRRVCVDPHRVYLTGFSNGAGFAARAGCELADRVAAIAPVAGSYRSLDPCPAGTRSMPTLEIHGQDPWLDTVPTLMSATAKRNGCTQPPRTTRPKRLVTRTVWPDCDLQRIRLARTAHLWPTRQSLVDNDASGLSASEAIWHFMTHHTRTAND
jgi:polyhydroxybutyrate depolymerase